MSNWMRDRFEQSPVLSGGITVFGVALALIALFVIGVLGGNVWNRSAGTAEPTSASDSQSASVPATDSAHVGPADSTTQADSGSAPAPNGDNAQAIDDSADLAATTGEPSDAGPASAYKPDWLSAYFGAPLAPASLADLNRTGIVVTGASVTADYTGGETGAIESARLVVSRLAKGEKTSSEKEAALGEFTEGRLEYERGGRTVTQGVTNEGRLDLFPPAIRFVWASGDHIVQFTIIPMEPGRASEARTAGLEFIDGLEY